jgi:hypothetical protein
MLEERRARASSGVVAGRFKTSIKVYDLPYTCF